MKKQPFLSAILVGVLAACLTAGPVNEAMIPAEIQWGVHWDKQASDTSQLGQRVQQELDVWGWQPMMTQFEQEWGFQPWRDVSGVTMFGNQRDCFSVVVILTGQFDLASIQAKLAEKNGYTMTMYGTHEIHSWRSQGLCGQNVEQQAYGAFLENEFILMSAGLESLEATLDVIDGRADALADTVGVSQIRQFSQNALFVGGADRLQGVIPMKGHRAVLLNHAREVVVSVYEVGNNVQVQWMLMMDTEATAANAVQVLQGMKAFAILSAEQKPMLAELAGDTQFQRDGQAIFIRMQADVERLVTFAKNYWFMTSEFLN